MKSSILEIHNLSIGVNTSANKTPLALVEDINFTILEGEIFGLIGESGCGKSITSLGIVGFAPEPNGVFLNGSIELKLNDKIYKILELSSDELRSIRGSEIGIIFQEPFMALNPLYTIGFHFQELYKFHYDTIKAKRIDFEGRLLKLLKRAGFSEPEKILNVYPHQLSGGMLQRIVIIIAILLKPKLIIADEPTTALDVTIQAQVMELLKELQQEEETSILLITHNMGLLAQYADRLAVMYAGRIVETTDIQTFLKEPLHPYSIALLDAIPDMDAQHDKKIKGIPGQVPSPEHYSSGCRFSNRCIYKFDLCEQKPILFQYNQNHEVYCWKYKN